MNFVTVLGLARGASRVVVAVLGLVGGAPACWLGRDTARRRRNTSATSPRLLVSTRANSAGGPATALAKDRVPREWPILILHDGQPLSVARVPQLIERFGAVDVRGTPLVAMLLLAKSSYLVGNPASTFSVNMADIRRASGAAEASTTLRYGHYWDV